MTEQATIRSRCWAHELGGCSDKLSGEHYVSDTFFTTNYVEVTGLAWCKTESKRIGLANATAKILCTHHNSLLSPIDDEIGKFMRGLMAFMEARQHRKNAKPMPWIVRRYNYDGPRLERWLLKTLINLTFKGDLFIGPSGTEPGRPALDLVRIAYGHEAFAKMAGMHFGSFGGQVTVSETLQFVPIVEDKVRLVGGCFTIAGMIFYLSLEENRNLSDDLWQMQMPGPWQTAALKHHGGKVFDRDGKYLVQVLTMNWK